MRKCRWCEERIERGDVFCDDLCRRLYQDYWATSAPASRYADPDYVQRELLAKRNRVRSG